MEKTNYYINYLGCLCFAGDYIRGVTCYMTSTTEIHLILM